MIKKQKRLDIEALELLDKIESDQESEVRYMPQVYEVADLLTQRVIGKALFSGGRPRFAQML